MALLGHSKQSLSLNSRLREWLSDGNWHPMHDVLLKFGEDVRPEVAVRLFLKVNMKNGVLVRQEPLHRQIVIGRRAYLSIIISGLGAQSRGPREAREYYIEPGNANTKLIVCVICQKEFKGASRKTRGTTCSPSCASTLSHKTLVAKNSEDNQSLLIITEVV